MKKQNLDALNLNQYMHDYIYKVAEYARLVEKMYLRVDSGDKIPVDELKVMSEKTVEMEQFGKAFRKRASHLVKVA